MTTAAPPATTAGELAKALRVLAPVRLSNTIPVMAGIRITPSSLTVSNLEVTATVPFSGLDLDVLVNAQAFRQAVEGFDPKADLLATVERPEDTSTVAGVLRLTAGRAEVELPLMVIDDYPALPDPVEATLHLDEQQYAELREVAKAASDETTRPVLMAVQVKWDTDGLYRFAATDSYRMAIYTGMREATAGEGEVLIPAESIGWLPKSDDGLGIGVRPDGTHATLYRGQATMVVRSIQGQPPAYDQFIPTSDDQAEAHFTQDALAEIKRVVDTVGPKEALRLAFTKGSADVEVSGRGENLNRKSTVTLAAPWEGDSMAVGANPAYLLWVLTYGAGRSALITPLRPVVVEDGPRRGLVMPIRLND